MSVVVPLAPGARGQASAPRKERPNILFICTDDQADWSMGVSGNKDTRTPNLDRLFRDGAHLTKSFVATPVCSPSRASLMTSRYGTEVGVTDYISGGEKRGLPPEFATWPRLLQEGGYRTGLVGKWHLGWSDKYHPTKYGYGQFVGFVTGRTGPMDPSLEIEGRVEKLHGSTPDILTDFAIEFIRQESARPFLLSLHYRAPHASNTSKRPDGGRTWLPLDDKDWDPFRGLKPAIPNPDYPHLDVPEVTRMMREYLASVASVDRNVGRLLGVLDTLGLAGTTIVIFTSDNGMNMGHNGIWHKGNGRWILTNNRGNRSNLYDNSLQVPTAVRWPGVIRPGTIVSETISNLDWFPTILAMAGLPPAGSRIRGRNLLPLLEGRSLDWDNNLYAEYQQYHGAVADLRMWRTRDWKLVRDFKNTGSDELYQLAGDPAESNNLIGSTDPQITSAKRVLNEKLLKRMREIG